MRIIRHAIEITDYQTVTLPHDGDLLSVAQSRTERNALIDLWSIDYEGGEPQAKGIYIIGTGNPMPAQLSGPVSPTPGKPFPWRQFIGTVVTPCGLVWHVFEGPVQS